MPDLAEIDADAAQSALAVLGGFPVSEDEPVLPPRTRTVLLFGPREPGFWRHFTKSIEFRDAGPDPLDRWSKRALGGVAGRYGGTALFPSDGPPYPPFQAWALRSGTFHPAPIGLLVHPMDGLLTSLRGAIALPHDLAVPAARPSPCAHCASQPCRTACPVGAFGTGGYAVATCHNHLDTYAGSDCMEQGCAARRACPLSQRSGRLPAQSAFHMRAFHGSR